MRWNFFPEDHPTGKITPRLRAEITAEITGKITVTVHFIVGTPKAELSAVTQLSALSP